MDTVEERMIFGNLSSKRGEELIENLKGQLSDKEKRLTELINETVYKQQQIVEADFKEDFNEDTMTLDDKIAIVKKVVKKITIVRTLKFTSHISIFNHINDVVSVYEVKGRKYTSTLIEEYNRKDKR